MVLAHPGGHERDQRQPEQQVQVGPQRRRRSRGARPAAGGGGCSSRCRCRRSSARSSGTPGSAAGGRAGRVPCGTFSSSTMMVMMIASTPSLKASSRPLPMRQESTTGSRYNGAVMGSAGSTPPREKCRGCGAEFKDLVCEYCGLASRKAEDPAFERAALDEFHILVRRCEPDAQAKLLRDGFLPALGGQPARGRGVAACPTSRRTRSHPGPAAAAASGGDRRQAVDADAERQRAASRSPPIVSGLRRIGAPSARR